MKKFLKKILGEKGIGIYHKMIARFGAIYYRNPSQKMIIIGITGTKGKSTTGNMLWHILTQAGYTVGLTGTVNYRIGEYEELTTNKMTMSGRMQLQKWLSRMVKAGCTVAIVETTSEGIKQYRHIGIHYDIVLLTNLTPEHIESHGSFEKYKDAKKELFRYLERLPIKKGSVQKTSVVNMDSEYGAEFSSIGSYTKIGVGKEKSNDFVIADVKESLEGTTFSLNAQNTSIPLLGAWNADNAALAAAAALAVGAPIEKIVAALPGVPAVAGRMEFIDEGQPFSVIVDYAYEPQSLELLYRFCKKFVDSEKKMITLISSTGGGRDVRRRPINGKVAATLCDVVIVTNEDPYDDDPQEIIDQVADGARAAGKIENRNLFCILDRKEAIEMACRLADPGDVVLLTAKGAEQKMCVANGKKIDWDDRAVVRDVLHNL